MSNPDFSTMTNRELGDYILNGEPGSQRSRAAILELIDRNERIKAELEHVWGIKPQPIEPSFTEGLYGDGNVKRSWWRSLLAALGLIDG